MMAGGVGQTAAAAVVVTVTVLLLLVEGVAALGHHPEPPIKATLSNKFVGVSSRCSRGSLTVDVSTEEAFFGSVYARGYPNSCREVGQGNTTTSLVVSAQKCGVKVIEDEFGHHTYELLVYIQFDKWVQQVIDEQVYVRCKLERQAGELKAQAQMNVMNEDSDDNTPVRHKDVLNTENNSIATLVLAAGPSGSKASSSSSTSLPVNRTDAEDSESSKSRRLVSLRRKASSRSRAQEQDAMRDWLPLEAPKELLMWQGKRTEGNSEPVSCWMDIVEGTSMDGKPVLEHLLVGDDTTMVLKVRQTKGLDTRITSCLAHDGSDDESQELIDENGCSVDDEIMPPLRIKFNPRSGVKVAYASFKAFKFPDRDHLHLRCTVLVCLGACQLPVCGRLSNRIGRRMGNSGQGSIQAVHDLQDLVTSPQQTPRGNNRALTNTIVDKVEVFNSVEVRAPGIESQPNLVKQYRTDRGPAVDSVNFFSDENMFCVTPYKMILAFGVLLTVLLVAMLFSLYSCVKARVLKARLQPPHHHNEPPRHSPVTSPYYRFAH
uniref:ZP domain-containing protein n=1 Tax=Scylla olivacea TaxID=85551 RepID=A0A0P4W2U0_SCYOL